MPCPGLATPDSRRIEVRSMLCCEFSTLTPVSKDSASYFSPHRAVWLSGHPRGVTIPLSRIRKLRLRKGWNPSLGLTARGWWSGFEPRSRHTQCQVCWLELNVFYSSFELVGLFYFKVDSGKVFATLPFDFDSLSFIF